MSNEGCDAGFLDKVALILFFGALIYVDTDGLKIEKLNSKELAEV